MKKCIVVSDSFKGTLSSQEICTLAAQRLEAYFPGCEVVRIPVADGGEGTVACFHEACGGTLEVRVDADLFCVQVALPLTEKPAPAEAGSESGPSESCEAAAL